MCEVYPKDNLPSIASLTDAQNQELITLLFDLLGQWRVSPERDEPVFSPEKAELLGPRATMRAKRFADPYPPPGLLIEFLPLLRARTGMYVKLKVIARNRQAVL